MSKYTTKVYDILKVQAFMKHKDVDIDLFSTYQLIELVRKDIFDFDYPIFDTSYKKTLETNFLSYFLMNEIGQETYALWKHYLVSTFNILMPKYNLLYQAINSDIDKFTSTNIKEEYKKDNTGESIGEGYQKTDSQSTLDHVGEEQDTPQNKNWDTGYASNRDRSTDESVGVISGNNTSKNNITNTENYVFSRVGTDIPFADLFEKFATKLKNIDQLLFDEPEIRELFMGIY